MKTIARLMLVAVLSCGAGCAKSDWIQNTLVTVDVTGIWVGGISRGGSYGPTEVRLELAQRGSKVTGYFRALPPYPPWGLVNGSIEGAIAGDVFTFQHSDGILTGKTTVDGDVMQLDMTASHRIQAVLRRVDPSPPPRLQ